MPNAGKTFELIANAMREFDPAWQAHKAEREAQKEQRAWEAKKAEIATKARETIWQKHFKQQAEAELAEKEREDEERQEGVTDLQELVNAAPETPDSKWLMGVIEAGKRAGYSDAQIKSVKESVFPKAASDSLKSLDEAKRLYDEGKISFEEYKAKVLGGGQTININTGDNIPIPKGAQSTIAKDLIAAQSQLRDFDRTKTLYSPKFSTAEFQIKSGAKKVIRRWGSAKKVADMVMPDMGKMDKDQADYLKWRFKAEMTMFVMRKFITGVAGGEKEMAMIEKMLPNAKDDALAYWSKLNEWELTVRKTEKALTELLESGIRKVRPDATFDDIDKDTRKAILMNSYFDAQQELADYTPEKAQQERDEQLRSILKQ